jgi:anti-sigma factor (TIGR02949 family)
VKCIEAKKSIDRYLDGEVSPSLVRAFEEHCADCPSCAKELAYAKKVRRALKTLPPLTAPKDFEAKLRARISKPEKRTFAKILFYPRHIKIPLEAAALFVIAILVTLNSDNLMVGDRIVKEASAPVQMNSSVDAVVLKIAKDEKKKTPPVTAAKSKADSGMPAYKETDDLKRRSEEKNIPVPVKEAEAQKSADESAPLAQLNEERKSREQFAGAAVSQDRVAKKSAVARETRSTLPTTKLRVNQMIQDAGGTVIESLLSPDGSTVIVRFTLPHEKLEKLLEDFSAAGVELKIAPVIGAKNVIRIEVYTEKK